MVNVAAQLFVIVILVLLYRGEEEQWEVLSWAKK